MYKQCRTEQSAARQRVLLKGLLEAMLQQHYDEITVSGLCERMEISRKSFYRYFSSKEGALHALIDFALLDCEFFSENRLCNGQSLAQKELERIFSYWQHTSQLLDALEKSGLSGVLVNRAVSHSVGETLRERNGLPPEEQQAQEYMMLFAVSGMMSMIIQWHHDGYPQTARQMAQIAVRLMVQYMEPRFIV